ncbi:MAG: hypothetical protein ACLQBX_02730 [Candidatus Limnocylindrales bacterium]
MGAEGAGGRATVVRQVLFMRRVLREVDPLLHDMVRRAWQATEDVDALLLTPPSIDEPEGAPKPEVAA